jgi:putative transposase
MQYRRAFIPGGCFFFTVVTAGREPLFADQQNVATLRAAFRTVRSKRPFALVGLTRRVKALSFVWE